MKTAFAYLCWLLFIGFTFNELFRLFRSDFERKQIVRVVILATIWVYYVWRFRPRRVPGMDEQDREALARAMDDGKTMVSLVLLLREPKYLDRQILERLVGKAWNVQVASDDDAEAFVVGESPLFVVKGPDGLFGIHNFDSPYLSEPEVAAAEIKELRSQKAMLEHRAWRSVDLLRIADGKAPQLAYPAIGKLVAELADEDCLAIVAPQSDKIIPYDQELDALLRSDDPMEVFASWLRVPVISVSEDDSRMRAAVEEARSRWPEFVAAFEARKPEQMFSVKVPFREGDECEFMWLSVTAIENDMIIGELGNDPVSLTRIKCGDKVRARVDELNDWMYLKPDGDEDPVGGFTVKVLMGKK